LLFLALCLGPVGCSGLGKKTSLPKAGPSDPSGPSRPPRDDGPPLPPPTVTQAGDTSGILAGRVVDYFSNSPPSRLWIVLANDGPGAPLYQTAETDRFGYFTISNLKPGQPYRLIAQTREGQFQQAGEVTVRPPNARVIIQVSQGRTPSLPGGAAESGPPAVMGAPTPLPPSGSPTQDPGAGVFMKPPVAVPAPDPTSGSGAPVRPENIVGDRPPRDPIINIPPQPRVPAPPQSPPSGHGPPLPDPPLAPVSATQIPSCDLRGRQLYNFALLGLDAQPWEYKRDRRAGSRLTLIDFWGSYCLPCRATIKQHLVPLNDLYGRQGLEVIGIAYEQEPTFEAQVRTASASARALGINYRVLMGSGRNCPVWRDFGVQGLPTLVLLNEKGQVIWTKVGMPTEPEFQQLKVVVRRELGIR
jgi:thiol-disulfide isomerase/thioredoxin